jgi:hypothetical protein
MFEAPAANDDELIFMVPPLANSLAHLGRWSEAEALYERAQQTWPIGVRANALNISANHALLLLEEGHADRALDLMDASLAGARHWGPQVGQTALGRMEHSRACMLHELGRDAEARVSMTEALAVERGSAAALLQLCIGDAKAAKLALLEALRNEPTREDVVRFMQPPSEDAVPSLYGRKNRSAEDALRADPELRQAVSAYGRIMPWRTNERASSTWAAANRSVAPRVQTRPAAEALTADGTSDEAPAKHHTAVSGNRSAPNDRACTTDGLIHAQVSQAITKRVTNSITLLQAGARVRDVAKLNLPCGFRLEARSGWNLVLTNGREIRRYKENNAFGFAPAFGFDEQNTKSYTLNYEAVSNAELRVDACSEELKSIEPAVQLCSSFGSRTAFFGASSGRRGNLIAHYVVGGSLPKEDFAVAEIHGKLESIFFLPPPDAPGGTITLIMTDQQGTYRAFVDTTKG